MTSVRSATILLIVVGVLGRTPAGAQTPDVRRLTVDDAVRLALEHNLGVRVARIDPQIQDLGVAAAQAAWSPTLTTSLQGASADSPSNSFLSGAQGAKTSDGRVVTTVGVEQAFRWGGRYTVGWDGSRSTTTNLFSNFSPQVRSSLSLSFQQPLLRGFSIDTPRQQLLLAGKDREVADMTLAGTLATTARAVRYAYWDLAYSRDWLDVQRQSLELARESLRNTRARIEIGTTPPIDEVEAEAEVALREEAVILAEAQIATAEDALRVLIYDPSEPTFWTRRIETTSLPPVTAPSIDLEAATNGALTRRTDLRQLRNRLEAADVSLQYSRNQTLPDVTASVDYGLTGLGGTQFVRGAGFPGPIIGQTERGFGSVLGDLLHVDFPSWTASLTVSYPIGATPQEANLARARLQYTQQQTALQNAALQVTAQVRDAARLVQTNQRRIETTAVSRQAAERRLDAEQRKLTAGTSTSFLVFQAQRDLAQARNNELRAALDLQRSLVDLETVQEAPLR
jgi:outer membrane protein TolC